MEGVKLLSLLTLISNIIVTTVALSYVFYKSGIYRRFWEYGKKIIDKYAIYILLIVSLVATLGSLYFSEIVGFVPCKLCWIQRIFMYPIPILLLTAIYKKSREVFLYSLPLSLTGFVIAGYHYFMQLNPNPYAPCGDIGFSVSCSENFFTHFGYITIPWMSFSAFLIITLVSFLNLNKRK